MTLGKPTCRSERGALAGAVSGTDPESGATLPFHGAKSVRGKSSAGGKASQESCGCGQNRNEWGVHYENVIWVVEEGLSDCS